MKQKIVLAYSGGLDTSAIIPWLINEHKAEVIAYCCDVGNLPEEKWLKERAYSLGASHFIFEDLKDEFVSEFVFPMLRAGATYQEDYLLGTAIARPLIATRIAQKVIELGANAIAHGATGKGNDQLRFENAWAYLAPQAKVIAPWRVWPFKGRQDLQSYLHEKGFDLSFDKSTAYSIDSNLMHTSTEGGPLEDIESEYPLKEIAPLSQHHPSKETELLVEISDGIPIRVNGEIEGAQAILSYLNAVGQKHGIGVADLVEERTNGIKSRGIYQTPGGTILQFCLRQLKQICWSRSMYRISQPLGLEYGELIYDGLWFSEARYSLEEFFKRASQNLVGTIGVKIAGGQISVTQRRSEFSLYNKAHVSFEHDEIGFNGAASGYSKFSTYPSLMAGLVKGKIR